MHYTKPCTRDQFSRAHLLDDTREHIVLDGLEMTAKNIWEKIDDREALVEKLVDYFYENEAPLNVMDESSVVQ